MTLPALSPVSPPNDGLRRSALLMRALGAKAASVWSQLSPDEAEKLSAEERMNTMREYSKRRQEEMMAERQRVRDSIRTVKKAEFDARREKLLEERAQRKDSILKARENKRPSLKVIQGGKSNEVNL